MCLRLLHRLGRDEGAGGRRRTVYSVRACTKELHDEIILDFLVLLVISVHVHGADERHLLAPPTLATPLHPHHALAASDDADGHAGVVGLAGDVDELVDDLLAHARLHDGDLVAHQVAVVDVCLDEDAAAHEARQRRQLLANQQRLVRQRRRQHVRDIAHLARSLRRSACGQRVAAYHVIVSVRKRRRLQELFRRRLVGESEGKRTP